MKINYLSEAFKPISKLKQDVNKISAEDEFRNSAVRDRIVPMLSDKDFKHYSAQCCARFIRPRQDYFFNAEINFKYINVDEDTINLTVELYYPSANATKASIHPIKELYLMDKVIREYTIEEIHKEIDRRVTSAFNIFVHDSDPELLNIATKIHVQRVYLWANAVEGDNEPAGNLYPLTINLESETTFGGTCVLDSALLRETFEKLSEVFTFCVKNLTLYKYEDAIVPTEKYSINNILINLIDKENIKSDNIASLKVYNNMYEDLISPAMCTYILARESLYIDLNDYIKTKHYDVNPDRSKNYSKSSVFILTKTPLSKLNTIKNGISNAVYAKKDIECLKDIGFFGRVYRWNYGDSYVYDIMLYRYGKFDGSCRLMHKMDI